MSNSKYEAFAAVAECSSFSKAASALGYTQSGISHLVRSLEEELGLTLLDRSRGNIHLTADGEKLLPQIQQLLASEQSVMTMVTELKGLSDGKLRIGSFSSFTVHLLPGLIRKFGEIYRGLDISVLGGSYDKIQKKLEEGEIDCAFLTEPAPEYFETTHLMDDKMMAVVPNMRPELLKYDWIDLKKLAEVPYIVPAEGPGFIAGELLRKAGIDPIIHMVMDDYFAAIAMCSLNFGYTILPELLLREKNLGNCTAIPITGACRNIGIAVYRGRYLPPAARAFVEFVKEEFKDRKI